MAFAHAGKCLIDLFGSQQRSDTADRNEHERGDAKRREDYAADSELFVSVFVSEGAGEVDELDGVPDEPLDLRESVA